MWLIIILILIIVVIVAVNWIVSDSKKTEEKQQSSSVKLSQASRVSVPYSHTKNKVVPQKKDETKDSYTGDYLDGKKNGIGTLLMANGDKYRGRFRADEFNGKGVFTWKNGDVYDGNFRNGWRSGRGHLKWIDGDQYIGGFKKGERTGRGQFKWANGDIYEGDFVQGKREGQGKYIWTTGDIYEGDFVNGIHQGKGRYTWSSGNYYEGDWLDGKRTGKGKFVWASGNYYEGDFFEGKFTGKGRKVWTDGELYEGDWVDSRRTGRGRYVWTNGDTYEGDFVNFKREGKGKFTGVDGDVYEGSWLNVKRIGKEKQVEVKSRVEKNSVRGRKDEKSLFSSDYPPIIEPDWGNDYDKIYVDEDDNAYELKDTSWLISLPNSVRHDYKKGCEYYALYDYFPKSTYPDSIVPKMVSVFRLLMYKFKDGRSDMITESKLISSVVYDKLGKNSWLTHDTIFIPIPASNGVVSKRRYEVLCKKVSSYLNIINGYDFIQRVEDRKKIIELGRDTDRLQGLQFDSEKLKGRKIVLFDDVITQGRSLASIKQNLIDLGAMDVIGVFLAETYDTYSRGYPHWYEENIDLDNPF